MTRRKYDHEEWARADAALSAIGPEADDATLAEIVADYLTAGKGPPYYLFILHDVRPSTERRLARKRKYNPAYPVDEPFGPCPLRYDWQRKNVVGIKTDDRKVATQWGIEALLLGYSLFQTHKIGCSGGGQGTLAWIRERKRERRADEERMKARRARTEEDENVRSI